MNTSSNTSTQVPSRTTACIEPNPWQISGDRSADLDIHGRIDESSTVSGANPGPVQDYSHTVHAEPIAGDEKSLISVGNNPGLLLNKADWIVIDDLIHFATKGYENCLAEAKRGDDILGAQGVVEQSWGRAGGLLRRTVRLLAVGVVAIKTDANTERFSR